MRSSCPDDHAAVSEAAVVAVSHTQTTVSDPGKQIVVGFL